MDDRESILAALVGGSTSELRALPDPFTSPSGRDVSWDRFAKNLEELGGRMAEMVELIQFQDLPAWVDEDAAKPLGALSFRASADIWQAEIGITMADWAVAESGTLLLSAGEGRRRMASLAPPRHVVLIGRDRLVGTLEEALAKLSERTSVMITGTSRTADIEGVLVRGVHGPKELWVVLLPPTDRP